MLGTHMSYKYRYPDTFNYFQSDDDLDPNLSKVAKTRINEFDNAIRYHDSILNQLLDIIQQQTTPSLAVYLADHGDDVYDSGDKSFQGRNESKPTLPMYAIPFFIYQSLNWQPSQNALNENLTKNFNSNDLIHLISDLVGFDYEDYDFKKSIANKHFTEKDILVGNPYEKKFINILEP
jgi:heptose-I-phosphate ethanolaminephosphotransferase